MNTIMNALESVKETIANVVSTPEPSITRAQIIALEEEERALRIAHPGQESVAKHNAQKSASAVSSLSFPYFKGGLNKGFKAHTNRAFELERQRSLASKQEVALRKNNAFLLSAGVKALGWPFIREAGPKFILTDSFKLTEEEERERRLADKEWAMNSRNNAALVSNLIRWDNYQRHTTAGAKRITKNLEEKERKSRLADVAERERAADLAFQTSGLIRRLGWPFYVQPTLDNKEMTRAIEEEEKALRLANPHERMLAQEKAGLVADLIHSKDASYLSEKEKERRIEDSLEQERHQAHAKRIAGIIAKTYDPSELERKRLLQDKAHSREAQLGAKKVADLVPHFMSVSSWSINRAVEKERTRRANDITAIAFAKFNAKKISNLVLEADQEKKTAWTNELEQERMRRMHDRVASDQAKKNARKVSKLITRQNTSSLSSTEGERARRLADLNEQQRHKNLAKRQAELIRQRSSPLASDDLVLPAATATRAVPTELLQPTIPSAPLAAAAPLSAEVPLATATRSIPELEQLNNTAPFLGQQQQVPLMNNAPYLGQQVPLMNNAPFLGQQAPLMNNAPFLGQQAPLYSSPLTTGVPLMNNAPFLGQQAPLYSSPLTTGMPLMSSPLAAAPMYSAPATLPAAYTTRSPSAVPVTFGSVPGTTYTTSTTYMPGANPAYVPYDAGVPSHLRVMTDKERKRLEKQASKHSRTSQREARKAEHDLSKAEKLHFRGKDNRAVKYETKAEQHNVAAKHHQAWAQELAHDSLSHTLPSAIPTVYRPAM